MMFPMPPHGVDKAQFDVQDVYVKTSMWPSTKKNHLHVLTNTNYVHNPPFSSSRLTMFTSIFTMPLGQIGIRLHFPTMPQPKSIQSIKGHVGTTTLQIKFDILNFRRWKSDPQNPSCCLKDCAMKTSLYYLTALNAIILILQAF